MTNTFGLTDYDVYVDEENDEFVGMHLRRLWHKKRRKKRRKKRARRRKLSRPPLGYPKVKGRPKIIKGRPMKRPPLVIPKGVPIIPFGDPRRVKRGKAVLIKKKPKSKVKPKTPINQLIKRPTYNPVKPSFSKASKKEVVDIKMAQNEASKKAMQSDGKVSKLAKVAAVVGVVGVTGFGIYKFIQNKNKVNGHISTSK